MSLLSDIGTAIKNKLGGTSVDNTVPRYDGTTCKLQGSGVTISDTNAVTASGGFVGNLTGNAETVTNGVYTTTNQTIEGVKTFSSSPIVPTPTTGTQAVNKYYVDNKAIGVGQTWQDMTSSRTVATTYTNTTGRTIHVLISANCNTLTTFEVNGISIPVQDAASALSIVSAPIPSGGTYRLGGGNELKWLELR